MRDQPERARRVESLHEHDAAAAGQRTEREVHQAADVVDRQVAENTGVPGRSEPIVLDGGREQQPLVGQHRGLGHARAARGEDDRRTSLESGGAAVVGRGCQRRQCVECMDQAVEVGVRHHGRRCVGLGEHSRQVGPFEGPQHEDDPGLDPLEHRRQFARRVARVQADVDRADPAGREPQQQVLRSRCAEHREAVARPQTGLGEPACCGLDRCVQIRVAPAALLERHAGLRAVGRAQQQVDACRE